MTLAAASSPWAARKGPKIKKHALRNAHVPTCHKKRVKYWRH